MRNEAQELFQCFITLTLTSTPRTRCCCRETYFTLTLAIFTTHYLGTLGICVTSALLQSCGKGKNLVGYLES